VNPDRVKFKIYYVFLGIGNYCDSNYHVDDSHEYRISFMCLLKEC